MQRAEHSPSWGQLASSSDASLGEGPPLVGDLPTSCSDVVVPRSSDFSDATEACSPGQLATNWVQILLEVTQGGLDFDLGSREDRRVGKSIEMIRCSGVNSNWPGKEKRTSLEIPWCRIGGLAREGVADCASDQEESRCLVAGGNWGEAAGEIVVGGVGEGV